jgi:hypothetical protein
MGCTAGSCLQQHRYTMPEADAKVASISHLGAPICWVCLSPLRVVLRGVLLSCRNWKESRQYKRRNEVIQARQVSWRLTVCWNIANSFSVC